MMGKGKKHVTMTAFWNREKLELNNDINLTFQSPVNENNQPNKRHVKKASHLKS